MVVLHGSVRFPILIGLEVDLDLTLVQLIEDHIKFGDEERKDWGGYIQRRREYDAH
jgi:hypothetical protein